MTLMTPLLTRGEALAAAKARLPGLAPRGQAEFVIAPTQPARRIIYGAVNYVAYRLWGAGNYRLEMPRGDPVLIVRRVTGRLGRGKSADA